MLFASLFCLIQLTLITLAHPTHLPHHLRSAVGSKPASTNATAHPIAITKRGSVTKLTGAQIAAYKPYTYYAGAAYCTPTDTLKWVCGREWSPLVDEVSIGH